MTVGSLEAWTSGDRWSRRTDAGDEESPGLPAASPGIKNLEEGLDEEDIFDDEEGDDYGGLDDELDEEFDEEFEDDEPDVDLDDEFEY